MADCREQLTEGKHYFVFYNSLIYSSGRLIEASHPHCAAEEELQATAIVVVCPPVKLLEGQVRSNLTESTSDSALWSTLVPTFLYTWGTCG